MVEASQASEQHETHDLSVYGRRILRKSHCSVQLPRHLQSGQREPHLFTILDHYLRADRSYIDMGAFIGATVLYAVLLARHCYPSSQTLYAIAYSWIMLH